MLENLLNNSFFYSLALTLIHFIWQGLLIAFTLKSALLFISDKNPQLRYALASLAMLACLLLPITTLWIIHQPETRDLMTISSLSPLSEFNFVTNHYNPQALQSYVVEYLPYVSLLWLSIVFCLALKVFIEIWSINRLPHQAIVPTNKELTARYVELVAQIGLKRKPRLLISLKTNVPMAIGWLKPVILLPIGMLSGLTSAQLEMLLLHELAHIRRHDYMVNFIQTLILTLLFFHPAVHWISKQMRHEREYCCDDIAVQQCGNAIAYAHTLADTADICRQHRKHTIPHLAMAASGGDLKQRVVRLVNHHCSSNNYLGRWFASCLIIISILTIASQQLLTPAFFDMGSSTISNYDKKQGSEIKTANNHANFIPENSIANQLIINTTSNFTVASLPAIIIPKKEQVTLVPIKPIDVAKTPVKTKLNKPAIVTQSRIAKVVTVAKTSKPMNKLSQTIIRKSNTKNTQTNFISHKIVTITKVSSNTQKNSSQRINYNVKKSVTQTSTQLAISAAVTPINLVDNIKPTNNNSSLIIANNAPIKIAALNNNKQSNINSDSEKFQSSKATPINVTSFAPNHQKAKLIRTFEPKYPSTAKRRGLELDIKVDFTIDVTGRIKDLKFEQQNKVAYFRNAIKNAMNKWHFRPAKLNGFPVESQMSKIFSFSLQG